MHAKRLWLSVREGGVSVRKLGLSDEVMRVLNTDIKPFTYIACGLTFLMFLLCVVVFNTTLAFQIVDI